MLRGVRPFVRPSACAVFLTLMERTAHILNVTHQTAARDAASVHFRPSITRTDILVVLE